VLPQHDVLGELGEGFHGSPGFILHGLTGAPFYLAMAGLLVAWFVYMKRPSLASAIRTRAGVLYTLLVRKYWFDELYQLVFAGGSRGLGRALWSAGDRLLIDGLVVNGSARAVGAVAQVVRRVQTGFLYHYAIAMILGLLLLLTWFVIA
jgi:NADH-quinone oxidoreductase subunit L